VIQRYFCRGDDGKLDNHFDLFHITNPRTMSQISSLISKPSAGASFTRPSAPRRTRATIQTQNAVKDVFMPALSSTMTEGKIVSWLKSPGDKVKKGEAIVVVESGKCCNCPFWHLV
jgi:biotin carboxyl carrier protein